MFFFFLTAKLTWVVDLKYNRRSVVFEDGHLPSQPQSREAAYAKFERQPLWKFGPVKRITLNDCEVFYSYQGSVLFDYSQVFSPENGGVSLSPHIEGLSRPIENLSEVRSFDIPFTVSTPFFRRHDIKEDGCNHQYLSFGTATPPDGHWTVACVLKNRDDFQYVTCEHIYEPEWETLFEDSWVPVARLLGYQKPSINTIGCSPATSLQGTRIAISNWDVIYVWALNPMGLTENNWRSNSYYPNTWRSYSSWSHGLVELRPAVFRLEAVCFSIIFTENEDIIMALTDKGLVTLDLRPQAQRRRLTLDMHIP